MAREFLIPWLLLVPIVHVSAQKEQPPGFEHVDHFQNIFAPRNEQPTFPQNPFALDGFRNLHNPQMIHPHHDLLVPAGVINPNFIPPHPLFLPQYPFTVGMEVPTTTAKPVKARSRELPAPRTASAESFGTRLHRAPQAVKPLVVGSVVSAESSTEMPVLDLNATASAVEGAESETTVGNANELKSLQVETTTFLPPSSSVQPVEITTTPVITSISTFVPTLSTDLPQTSATAAQNGAVNEGQINLIKHLNTSDLESFLHSANLSTNEAQTFLKLVEKVLEGELQNRLQRRNDPETSTNPATNSTETATIPTSSSPQFYPLSNNPSGHEVKTVNTRLSYESQEIEPLIPIEYVTTKETPTTPPFTRPPPKELKPRVVAFSHRSAAGFDAGGKKARENVDPTTLDDVRKQEQEEFDRLLGQIVLEERSSENERTTEETPGEDDDLLPPVVPRQPSGPLPSRGVFNRPPPNRHEPHTNFERLVEDYKMRLSGSNGFNDFIRALRNAHIGFFDRTKRRQKVRIN